MTNKPLVFGIVGFLVGGFIVSLAAVTINKPEKQVGMTMREMNSALDNKKSDAYDEAFLRTMIEHHEGALDMAQQSAANARHDEIKKLSQDIIATQEKEIAQMKQWQKDWGYKTTPSMNSGH